MDKPPTIYDDLANLMRNVPNYQQKIPDVDAYVASIDIPETVEGPVGGCEQPEPRYVQRNSPQGQAIVAAQLKREREAELLAMETEGTASVQPEAAPVVVAAAAPAPAATVEVTEPLHRPQVTGDWSVH